MRSSLDPPRVPEPTGLRRDISVRRAQEAAAAAQATVVEFSTDAILTLDPQGTVLSWNAGAELVYGYPAHYMIGRNAEAVLAPPDRISDREELMECLKRGESAHRELTLIRADGRAITVSGTTSPVLDAEGKLVALCSISRDISAAKEVERALQESEERYRLLVDLSTDAITRVSPSTGLILYASPSITHLLGWTAEELVGKPFEQFVSAESGPSQADEVMAAGEVLHVRTMQLSHRDGSQLWCESSSRAMVSPTTGAPEIQSSIRDISARVVTQEALAASEERFRLTQRHAPIGLALVGMDGRYLQVNPALCNLLGRTEQELMSLTFNDITHPDDLDEDLALHERLRRGDLSSYQLQKRYLRPDGTSVWTLLSVVAMLRPGAEPHFIAQVLDISARMREEAALSAMTAELVTLNDQLDTLSRTDMLTGAFNRRHLDEVLGAACDDAQRHGDPAAVLLIDIDHFKLVNDRFGHRRGDDVLKVVVERLSASLRAGDTLGRWGGEEFMIVLPRTDREGAVMLAERVRSCIADELVSIAGGDAMAITVSVGVAYARHPVPDALMTGSDRALYSAKASGRNRVAVA